MAGLVTIFIDLCPLPYGRSSHDIYRSQSTALLPMAGDVTIFIDLSQLLYGW